MRWSIILFLIYMGWANPIEIEISADEQAILESPVLAGVANSLLNENWTALNDFFQAQQKIFPELKNGDIVIRCHVGIGAKGQTKVVFSSFHHPQFEQELQKFTESWDYTSVRAADAELIFIPMHLGS